MQVKDKLAVVTGGARRLGRAIVAGIAADGARVVIHCHDSLEEAHALAREVDGYVVQADLARPEGAAHLASQVMELAAQVQCELGLWVNAASTFERTAFLDSEPVLWQRTLQLVVLSPADLARRVAPVLSDGALVVNVLDIAAHQPWKGYAHHCVAKAALLMLTRSLALELAPRVRVCGVSPGLLLPLEEEDAERLIRRVPLGRVGQPADLVEAVRYLVQADYLTGTVVTVDGGLTARSPTG